MSKKQGIAVVILGMIIFILLIVVTYFPQEEIPPITLLRERAIDEGCLILRDSFDCDISKLNEITVQHQDPSDSQLRDYSLKELCDLLDLTQQECAQRCGCG